MSEKDDKDGTKHIIQSLLVNVAIALAKGVAAFFTDRCLALIGVPPEAAGRARVAA